MLEVPADDIRLGRQLKRPRCSMRLGLNPSALRVGVLLSERPRA